MFSKVIGLTEVDRYPLNFKWVTDKVAGMSRPGIGARVQNDIESNPDRFDSHTMKRELDTLYRNGVRQIFSLAPEFRQQISAYWASFTGTQFVPIDLPDCALPEGNEQVLDEIISKINSHSHKSVIHCTGGIGRTGFILTAYAMTLGDKANKTASDLPITLRLFDQNILANVTVTPPVAVSNAVQFVRKHYNDHAVEFTNQIESLARWQLRKPIV